MATADVIKVLHKQLAKVDEAQRRLIELGGRIQVQAEKVGELLDVAAAMFAEDGAAVATPPPRTSAKATSPPEAKPRAKAKQKAKAKPASKGRRAKRRGPEIVAVPVPPSGGSATAGV